jgi:hypothetical protein
MTPEQQVVMDAHVFWTVVWLLLLFVLWVVGFKPLRTHSLQRKLSDLDTEMYRIFNDSLDREQGKKIKWPPFAELETRIRVIVRNADKINLTMYIFTVLGWKGSIPKEYGYSNTAKLVRDLYLRCRYLAIHEKLLDAIAWKILPIPWIYKRLPYMELLVIQVKLLAESEKKLEGLEPVYTDLSE